MWAIFKHLYRVRVEGLDIYIYRDYMIYRVYRVYRVYRAYSVYIPVYWAMGFIGFIYIYIYLGFIAGLYGLI